MKKTQILIISIIVASLALFSFKKAELATRYGGTASVKINIVQVVESSGVRTILSSPTLNASESCTNSNAANAKSRLQRDLESQADSKKSAIAWKPFVKVEWEYDSEISYRITTCD